MISLNQPAPNFMWIDAYGKAQSLLSLRDLSRIVVLFAHDAATTADWQKTTLERAGEFAERDMVSLLVGPFAPLPSLRDEDGHIARSFGVEGQTTAFFLIGKDGTVKRTEGEVPAVNELWAQIDSMPMRRREIRERS